MAFPENYERLNGSERRPSPTATRIGPADSDEKVEVTIVLRRRVDGQPLPRPEDFPRPPGQRQRLSGDEFAALYGASPEDLRQVTELVTSHGLAVIETNAARRTVTVSGSVEQMSETFAVELAYYDHDVTRKPGDSPHTERYRGRDGFIHVPRDLVDLIVGVFGLDNRRITKRNATSDPPNTTTISVTEAASLYNFPTNSANGQTIAIFSEAGYHSSDIFASFSTTTAPSLIDVSVDAPNDGSADGETTQDIYIAASAAPGANIAVYFTTYSQKGWVDLIQRVVHPLAGDPTCSVLSSSFYVSDGDDPAGFASSGISTAFLTAATAAFQDAAIQHVTVCIASGDTGTQSKIPDGKAHVQYPASDPWVLSVGGTTIGNVRGKSFDEYVWNDDTGATGGGISDFFPPQAYQNGANVPASLNDPTHTGRGVPDVAANASPHSGYPLIVGGSSAVGNGTSASAPLWAGLIAVLNAALGENVGFVNPTLYEIGSNAFRDIVSPPGPADNGFNGVAGYPVRAGWDACTGWGSPNGAVLLAYLGAPGAFSALPGVGATAAYGQVGLPQTDLFAIDKHGQLSVHFVAGGGRWLGPLPIGAVGQFPPSAPLAAGPQFGLTQTDVFAVDTSGTLTVSWVSGGGVWQGPVKISGPSYVPGAPVTTSQQFGLDQTLALAVDKHGTLTVAWVGQGGNWNGPDPIGSSGMFTPSAHVAACQQFGLTQTDVFVVDPAGALTVSWVSGGGTWAGPVRLTPVGVFPPGCHLAAGQQIGLNQTDVFAVDTTGAMTVTWVGESGNWNGPARVSPAHTFVPGSGVATTQQFGLNQTDVFAVDMTGTMTVSWIEGGGTWQGPAKIGSAGRIVPATPVSASQQIGLSLTDVFVIDNGGHLNIFWASGGGTWEEHVFP